MNWFYLSCINVILYTTYVIIVKYISQHVDNLTILTYMSLFSILYIGIYQILSNKKIKFEKISIIFGIWTGIIYYLLNSAISIVSNPGLVLCIFRFQIIISSIMSYFIYGSHLSTYMMIMMCIILVGLFIITAPIGQGKTIKQHSYKWIILSFIAAIMGSIGIIILKYININIHNKYNYVQIIFNIMVGICIFSAMNEYITTKSLYIKYKSSNSSNIIYFILLMILGVVFPLYSYLLIKAVHLSPSPSMPFAIISSNIIPVSIISTFLFKNSELTYTKWGGIGIVLVGVFGLYSIK